MTAPIPRFKILSMDGASTFDGGGGYVTVDLLQRLEAGLQKRRPRGKKRHGHFLSEVDIFAGTSSGGWTALFLAHHLKKYRDPARALDDLLEFWKDIADAMAPTATMLVSRALLALAGQCSFTSVRELRDLFTETFEDWTLGDLAPERVVIVTFQLDDPKEEFRRWKPKVFNNFPGDEDCDELVVDVMMRTGASPILTPIIHGKSGAGPGFIDGGTVANSPAVCALAHVFAKEDFGEGGRKARKVKKAAKDRSPDLDYLKKRPVNLDQVLLLSIGNGFIPQYVDPEVEDGMADWGYADWLLQPSEPALLVHLMLEGTAQAVTYQCAHLLGHNFFRLQPLLNGPVMALSGNDVDAALRRFGEVKWTHGRVDTAVDWMLGQIDDGVNWFE